MVYSCTSPHPHTHTHTPSQLQCSPGMTVQQVIEAEIPDIARTGYQVYQFPSRALLNPEKDASVLQDQEISIEPMRFRSPGVSGVCVCVCVCVVCVCAWCVCVRCVYIRTCVSMLLCMLCLCKCVCSVCVCVCPCNNRKGLYGL